MNNEKELSGFLNEVKAVAENLQKEVVGKNRGFIIIATADNEADENEGEAVIAIGGTGKHVIEGLAQFFSNPQTKPIVDKALSKLAFDKLTGLLTEVAQEIGSQYEPTKEPETENKPSK